MRVRVVTPDGKEFTIDGQKLCHKSSPEVCSLLPNEELAGMLIDYAWHQGYEVEVEKAD